MTLAVGEVNSGGFVRDKDGRLSVTSEGSLQSGGFLRDSDGRLVLALSPSLSEGSLITEVATSTGNVGKKLDVRHGTEAAPITGDGSTIHLSRVDAITQADHNGFSGASVGGQTTDTGLLSASILGGAASETQVEAITAFARNKGTAGQPDACAIRGSAWQKEAGSGVAIGAYLRARNDIAGGSLTGLEVQAQNKTGSFIEVSDSSFTKASGVLISAGSSTYEGGGAGIQFHHPTGWPKLDVGIQSISNDGGPFKTAFLRDNSEALRSVDIRGKHSKGAITVAKEAGQVVIGAEEASEATPLLEVSAGGVNKNPLVKLGAGGTGLFNVTQQFNAGGSTFNIGQVGSAGSLMTGTAAGDTTFALGGNKVIHFGKASTAAVFKVGETGLGFFGTAPQAKPTSVAKTAEAIWTALNTLGLIA